MAKKTKLQVWTGDAFEDLFPETHISLINMDGGDNLLHKLSEIEALTNGAVNSVEGLKSNVNTNTADISSLRQAIISESHFRGYVLTRQHLNSLEANENDYAYSADSGTKWIFQNGAWIDSGIKVPDKMVPASNLVPFMSTENGYTGEEEAYARGDHRHPTDTSRIGVKEKGQPNGVASLDQQGQVPKSQVPHLDYLPLTGGALEGDLVVPYSVKAQIFDTGKYSFADDGIWNGDYAINPPEKNGTIALIEDLAPIETKVELINQALSQSGIIYKQSITQEYNERVTADGLNVLDGSKAVLKKVVGSTVKCNNLLGVEDYDNTESGVKITVKDNKLTLKGTATGYGVELWIPLKNAIPQGNYSSFVAGIIGSNVNGLFLSPADRDYSNRLSIATNGTESKSFTTTFESKYLAIYIATGNVVDCSFDLMLNAGSTALPYQPYFTGLKSASFAGIESTSGNLFNAKAIKNAKIKVNDDGSKILMPLVTDGNGEMNTLTTLAELCPNLKVGDEVYLYYDDSVASGNGMIYLQTSKRLWYRNTLHTIMEQDLASVVSLYGNRYVSGYTEQVTLLNFRIVRVKNAPFAPYIEPSVFNFPNEELGKWDSIDFENQKVVRGTKIVVFDGTENWELQSINDYGIANFLTHFNERSIRVYNSFCNFYTFSDTPIASTTKEDFLMGEGGLYVYFRTFDYTTPADWKAHLAELYASGNPLMIAYELATAEETPFTAEQSASGNEYEVQKGGTERVKGNDNAEFGAENTLTQDYILVTEVK